MPLYILSAVGTISEVAKYIAHRALPVTENVVDKTTSLVEISESVVSEIIDGVVNVFGPETVCKPSCAQYKS